MSNLDVWSDHGVAVVTFDRPPVNAIDIGGGQVDEVLVTRECICTFGFPT